MKPEKSELISESGVGRREWFRRVLRYAGVGAVGVVSARLLWQGEACDRPGACEKCRWVKCCSNARKNERNDRG